MTTTRPRPGATGAPTSPVSPGSLPSYDVFFDPTGRRWRRVQIAAALLALLVVVGAALSWQPLSQSPELPYGAKIAPMPHLVVQDETPMIGVGPLARVVRVQRTGGTLMAIDPVTNQPLGAITGDDADEVGKATLALQHYGYSSAAHKTLELTFDDGPDPTWTPQILDLLSRYKAPATFFVIGDEVVKYPEIVDREVREGFSVGNHTLTHPDLQLADVAPQFQLTDRLIRASTGVATNLIRLPYDSNTGTLADEDRNAVVVQAERLGYIVSIDEFDTSDWKYGDPALRPTYPIPLPPDTEDNLTILLHDGGGDRSATVAYLKRLLPWALAHGYTFHSLPEVSPQVLAGTTQVQPSVWDDEILWLFRAVWSGPNMLIAILFGLAILAVIGGGGLHVLLALCRRVRRACHARRARFRRRPADAALGHATESPISIAVAAYNEEKVIARTLEALCRSDYRAIAEIIVVDDGSSDRTCDVVAEMAAADPRIRLLQQNHGGKAAALNLAFAAARSPIVVTLDADTLFTPSTVGNLVRHFTPDNEPRLAAVAGVVKVGNLRNLLTRWQALDYITMIAVDRGAQDVLHAIMIVPGACAAWSRAAVLRVGGYSRSTLAEDCDLALHLQQAGYSVSQDDAAVCYTEAPETVRALARQRFRWMYGTMQAMWKHRRMTLNPRYGWLGMLTLPLAVVSIVLPVVFLPFVYVMAVVTFEGQGMRLVLIYAAIFLLAQSITSTIGIVLAHERPSHLLMVPFYRLLYEPLRAYILYKSILTILRGTQSTWNKLQRKGTVAVELADVEAQRA